MSGLIENLPMLQLADFDDYAEKIRPHIDEIGTQSHRPRLFHSIQEACNNNDAFLFVAGEAFMVVKPIVTDGVKKLLVWVAWSREGNAINRHFPQLVKIARLIDAEELECWTTRESLSRYVQRLGWEKKFTILGYKL